jgi:bleomycin hydrolase
MERGLTSGQVEIFTKQFDERPGSRLLQNAVTATKVDQVALDHQLARSIDRTVSHRLDDWKPTDQKQSGRCWMFAGLNLLRPGTAKKLGVKELELSQNHLMFFDKLEKANHWLESIIATADRDVDDRTVAHLLGSPSEDGGQWNMFAALVAKHGLVPQSVMPETVSSSATRALNRDLARVLRQAARDLRAQAADGAGESALRETKADVLGVVHGMLCLHLGTPPTSFHWQWRDEDKVFHRDGDLTPREFAERYVTVPLDDYVCLVHDARESSPYGRTYTVEHLGNVVDGPEVVYLNVEMEVIEQLAMRTIVGSADRPGEPVWFGCDVDHQQSVERGLWDAHLFDYDALYGTTTDLTRAERLEHHEAAMTHAMLLTGVDVVEGEDGDRPRRWRVENSWGTERGEQGYWTMNASWFAEHVFEIAVRRDLLPDHLLAALDEPPIVLPAWDPMGALAR